MANKELPNIDYLLQKAKELSEATTKLFTEWKNDLTLDEKFVPSETLLEKELAEKMGVEFPLEIKDLVRDTYVNTFLLEKACKMENYFPAIRDINKLDEEELLKRFIRERKEGMYVDSPEKVSPQVLYVIKRRHQTVYSAKERWEEIRREKIGDFGVGIEENEKKSFDSKIEDLKKVYQETQILPSYKKENRVLYDKNFLFSAGGHYNTTIIGLQRIVSNCVAPALLPTFKKIYDRSEYNMNVIILKQRIREFIEKNQGEQLSIKKVRGGYFLVNHIREYNPEFENLQPIKVLSHFYQEVREEIKNEKK
ncbi:hypothetical protein ACFVIX_06630 [Bacillus subtilis]|uniref:Uncharacterized protein n=1 Tax=Bacillus subtilis TaxID=1423 RepID=A0A0D1KE00_BACIU|nr:MULTISPECIES: hypothetical protein [Bacillus subtilis group]AVB12100.1 hypothetical protein C3438_21810 [Bacillus velezensis]AYK76584.1 hypothetical protein D9C12_22840 [Bacillus subtilis subsp. subtilis]AYL03214.1 hypothetical protein D9C08_22995 [Bacillus subtilis subsp. subtilis]KIU04462.1 hypothetical protein SC09_contig8orf00111 [Bacillus subtilis]MCB4341529.1 hypothetical protein [Bacillus subtilis]